MGIDLDTGRNWVNWLREQAEAAFVWDEGGQYWRVRNARIIQPHLTLREAFNDLGTLQASYPNLHHNFMVSSLPRLTARTFNKIEGFFRDQDLSDFEFLNHGGRAIVFRARHQPTGQIRLARIEAPHRSRQIRPDHPVIMQPFASNEGTTPKFQGVKLEVMEEIVPLSHLYWKNVDTEGIPILKKALYEAIYGFARGTNLMYPITMCDRDAEAQNVGLRHDGKIKSFDPEIITGEKAAEYHRYFQTTDLLRDANAQQLALVYPV